MHIVLRSTLHGKELSGTVTCMVGSFVVGVGSGSSVCVHVTSLACECYRVNKQLN